MFFTSPHNRSEIGVLQTFKYHIALLKRNGEKAQSLYK